MVTIVLQRFVCKGHSFIQVGPLLVLMAQVLEASRWNILTFSREAATVCEEATNIICGIMRYSDLWGKRYKGMSSCNFVQPNCDIIYPI
jgi:hypothetical protein